MGMGVEGGVLPLPAGYPCLQSPSLDLLSPLGELDQTGRVAHLRGTAPPSESMLRMGYIDHRGGKGALPKHTEVSPARYQVFSSVPLSSLQSGSRGVGGEDLQADPLWFRTWLALLGFPALEDGPKKKKKNAPAFQLLPSSHS